MISQIIIGAALVGKSMRFTLFITLLFYLYCKIYKKNIDALKVLIFFVIATYYASVAMATGIFDFTHFNLEMSFQYNLIPFQNEELKLIILNFLMFLPFGFF